MRPPTVTVVVPSARGGPYLRETVASVLAQSFEGFELIVVADGCDDDLVDVEALDPRIRVIRQKNRGESVARNVGVRAARAELIAFIDDDDRMLPGRLRAQFEAMNGLRDAGLCHTLFHFIDSEGSRVGGGYAREVDYLDLLRGELGVLMPTTMMRKSLLQEVGLFDSSLRTCQDVDVILRLARRNKLIFLDQKLTEYRVHGGNASADGRVAGEALEALIAKHRLLAQRGGDVDAAAAARVGETQMRRMASTGHVAHARQAWQQHDPGAAALSVVKAARLSPMVTVRDLAGNRRAIRALRAHLPLGATRREENSE
jgi:glycosyltransferase involved in cell wall biosynthesis